MEFGIAVTAIIGFVGAVQKQFPQVVGLIGVGLSVLAGALLGYFNYLGVNGIEQGILAGLSASGLYVVAKRAGGN